mmetsp:Transcript_23059/g.50565  ORF Transcript_23059/g.50565 Transcript_23059/m.50565 type:complete len:460 (-) Transcript_23059:118-1497(-)
MGVFRSTKLPSCNAGPFCPLPCTPPANAPEGGLEDLPAEKHEGNLEDKLLQHAPNGAHTSLKQSKHQQQERALLKKRLARKLRNYQNVDVTTLTTRIVQKIAGVEPGQRQPADLVDMAAMCAAMIPVVASLSPTQQLYLFQVIEYRRFNRYEFICRQGEEGDYFYIIIKGTVSIVRMCPTTGEEIVIGTMSSGTSFGETAMLYNTLRAADITCSTPYSDILMVNKQVFNELFQVKLAQLREITCEFLKAHIKCFRNLPESSVMDFGTRLTESVFKEGMTFDLDTLKSLSIIQTGELHINHRQVDAVTGRGVLTELAKLGPGQVFGEACVFEEMKTGWWAKAKTDVVVYQIRSENFLDYVDKRVYKRLQNELAFRNAYFAGRRGMQMDFRARHKARKNFQEILDDAYERSRRTLIQPAPVGGSGSGRKLSHGLGKSAVPPRISQVAMSMPVFKLPPIDQQ